MGFMVLEALGQNVGVTWSKNADLMGYLAKSANLVFLKPTTFMNAAGQAVLATANFYKIEPRDILVVADELDLDFGRIRLAFGGSAAGHKGVESVIAALGTFGFGRLRVGIGKPEGVDGEKYVLEDFSQEERAKLDKVIGRATAAVKSYIDEGIEATMNRFN